MAQDDPARAGNGSDTSETAPQAATLGQYIKDLSVESPSAPAVYQWQDQAALDVSFNLNVEKVSDDVHEVMLKVEVKAQSQSGIHFLVDLSYAGLFGIRNFPEEALAPFLLVEAPRLLFPFVRQIICDSVQNMGFPPLLLDPIDFAAAYMQQMQAAQQQGGDASLGTTASDPAPAGEDEGKA
ncbi:protein-export chaperone SecB [Sphingomonas sabuli]|uniref:Protein-export protein SecB n=1 Tax=Sphingomonas sabuli TaxID=2764186 RepID=A0A7G9L2Q7_9SPHN|nr:protein-export chaperone SecB [Sphingomonas sabuli]QNM82906.1 protein-export chaperone SecB [Sphingomonas sabuli]